MFRYLVMTARTPEFQPSVIDQTLRISRFPAAAGETGTGRSIHRQVRGRHLIKASNLDEARTLAFSDPVHTSGSSVVTVYEWNAK